MSFFQCFYSSPAIFALFPLPFDPPVAADFLMFMRIILPFTINRVATMTYRGLSTAKGQNQWEVGDERWSYPFPESEVGRTSQCQPLLLGTDYRAYNRSPESMRTIVVKEATLGIDFDTRSRKQWY